MGRTTKKSQQEMVGFVIIVVMVIIIGVVFLGISLRNSANNKGVEATDSEIANFLSASRGYVTDCVKEGDSEPAYRTLEGVIEDCYNQRSCNDGRKSCEVLNSTYSSILPGFRPAGQQISAYSVNFYYQQNCSMAIDDSTKLNIGFYYGQMDGCSSRRAGSACMNLGEGAITQILEVCMPEE